MLRLLRTRIHPSELSIQVEKRQKWKILSKIIMGTWNWVEWSEDLASLEAPDDEGGWCWPKRNRITRWGKRENQRPTFHYFAERRWQRRAGVWRTEIFGPTKRRRSTMDMEESHSCGPLGSNVMSKSMFPGISTEETERSNNGKGFKDSGGKQIKNNGQQVIVVRTPKGFAGNSTWLRMWEDPLCRHLTASNWEATCSSGSIRHASWTGRRRNKCSERITTCT